MKTTYKRLQYFVLLLISSLSLCFHSSCVNTQKATYFNDLKDSSFFGKKPIPETLIQQNDILIISVSSLNKEATAVFNLPNVANMNGQQPGYLVNRDGTILFPLLGRVQAAGLSKEQVSENLTRSLKERKLLIDPIVNVRFQNFRVTVLGEVKNPSVIPVPSEKISLLEAIGLAGDLTIYAKRNNVLLIREENGSQTVMRINLNSSDLFSSPYYYLKSNDIVYIEPNKAKVASGSRGYLWVPSILGGLSFLAIVADRLFR